MVPPLQTYFGIFSGEEALLEAAVHGERNQHEQSFISQQSEGRQEGAEERFVSFVVPKLSSLVTIDVVQKHGHQDHRQNTHTCNHSGGEEYTNTQTEQQQHTATINVINTVWMCVILCTLLLSTIFSCVSVTNKRCYITCLVILS